MTSALSRTRVAEVQIALITLGLIGFMRWTTCCTPTRFPICRSPIRSGWEVIRSLSMLPHLPSGGGGASHQKFGLPLRLAVLVQKDRLDWWTWQAFDGLTIPKEIALHHANWIAGLSDVQMIGRSHDSWVQNGLIDVQISRERERVIKFIPTGCRTSGWDPRLQRWWRSSQVFWTNCFCMLCLRGADASNPWRTHTRWDCRRYVD